MLSSLSQALPGGWWMHLHWSPVLWAATSLVISTPRLVARAPMNFQVQQIFSSVFRGIPKLINFNPVVLPDCSSDIPWYPKAVHKALLGSDTPFQLTSPCSHSTSSKPLLEGYTCNFLYLILYFILYCILQIKLTNTHYLTLPCILWSTLLFLLRCTL